MTWGRCVLVAFASCAPASTVVDSGTADSGTPVADAGPPDAGAPDTGQACLGAPVTLSWDAGHASLTLHGQVLGSALDPPAICYRMGWEPYYRLTLDRPATLDAQVNAIAFSPFVVVDRGCGFSAGPFAACGPTGALQGVPLDAGTYFVVVVSKAIGSGPDAGDYALQLSFTSADGG